MTTYLEIVNKVLVRLRESTVNTVTQTPYSSLIGVLVNDSKRSVEDAFAWDANATTLTVTTTSSVSSVTVTGSGLRHKGSVINDTTNKFKLTNVPLQWIVDQQQLTTVQTGNPAYYAWSGNDGTDSKIELFPTPNGTFTLKVNLNVPQLDLSAGADVINIPTQAIEQGAYARALVERGEDGGLNSSEAYLLYKTLLADQIAIESSRYIENECWVAN